MVSVLLPHEATANGIIVLLKSNQETLLPVDLADLASQEQPEDNLMAATYFSGMV